MTSFLLFRLICLVLDIHKTYAKWYSDTLHIFQRHITDQASSTEYLFVLHYLRQHFIWFIPVNLFFPFKVALNDAAALSFIQKSLQI